jgi:branched-subunit amino acid transport protein
MNDIWAIIAGMALVTFLPRITPLLLLPGMKMPEIAKRWLSLVAPAILSALLFPELLLDKSVSGGSAFSLSSGYIIAAAPSFLVALRTKSLFAAVITGISAMAVLRFATHI